MKPTKPMFGKDDLEVGPLGDLLEFLVIAPFVGLIFPFLGAAYTVGFIMEKLGWNET